MENYQYAGFWIRVLASLIDSLVLLCVIGIPLSLIYGSAYWTGTNGVHGYWDLLLSYILPVIATIWFWTRYCGTPGKMVLKLKILDAKTGNKPTVPQSVLRYVGYMVSIIPMMLGFIWVGIDKKKQGFHDKIAGTIVVRDLADEKVRFDG